MSKGTGENMIMNEASNLPPEESEKEGYDRLLV